MSRTSAQRVAYRLGVLFLASGLVHVGVWLAAGMPSLEGPVTWRKPITFGFSTGVLCLSIAWVLGVLQQTRRLVWQARAFAALLFAEIALIDMQQWRGVASHFNTATPFDGAVFTLMGLLIVAASTIVAAWTIALFRQPLATTPAYAFAARAGMIMLNVGNVVGIVMAATQATQLKPIHGITLHVLQALPVMLWLAARLRYPRAWVHGLRSSRWFSLRRWASPLAAQLRSETIVRGLVNPVAIVADSERSHRVC